MVKRPSNICQFFLVLNPDGFAGSERYGPRVTHIAEVIGKAKAMVFATFSTVRTDFWPVMSKGSCLSK